MRAATRVFAVSALVVALLAVAWQRPALTQEPQPAAPEATEPAPEAPLDYGRVEAGQESHQRAEAQRQADFRRQAELNEDMRASAAGPAYYPYAPGVTAVYAAPGYGWRPRRAARYGVVAPWGVSAYWPYGPMPLRAYRSVFEPWPVVPGRVYGYPYMGWVPQPIGQVEVQIRPGVTLSRPDYGPGPAAPQQPTPAQGAAEPVPAPAPSGPVLPDPNPPDQPAQPGPREF